MEVIEKEKPPSGDRVKDKLINFRIIFEKVKMNTKGR
jgi:hypothetical protein